MMRRWPQHLHWGACFALALGFHAAGAAALLARWNESSDLVANAPLIMIDLAPVAVAPTTIPNEMPPDIVNSNLVEPTLEPEPEPEPPKQIELPPDPAPKPELSAVPPPKPPEKKVEKKKEPRRIAQTPRAPSNADTKANRTAAPMPGAAARNSNAEANWKSQLFAQISRHKQLSGTERGIVQVAFGVDRSGGVHNARVLASSGSSALDREALALLRRSQPLPPPPPEIPGSQVPVVLPVRYNTF